MENLEINCLSIDEIEQVIANDLLKNLKLSAITRIRDNKKVPDVTSIFEYLNKTVRKSGITNEILESRFINSNIWQQTWNET